MSQSMRYACALLLALVCLPLAAADCPAIDSLAAGDVQTGEAVTITWSYSGGAPQSQTLSGSDFEQPVVVPPGATSYTYTPYKPGEKHIQLSAASACGTAVASAKYHVKRCSIVEPVLTVSASSVDPGETIQASLTLPAGHTARWEVRNGTASATTGSSISIVAGAPGTVEIDAYVSRGKSCTVKVSATVLVEQDCPIAEPEIHHPAVAVANEYFWLYIPSLGAGETVSFDVHNAEVLYSDQHYLDLMAPATGSFSVDVIVTNGTCSRTFTRTFELTPCSPTATVMAAGTGACDDLRVAAEFTGTAPFQGYWSDGTDFYTYENRIERTVSSSGTYTLLWFRDAFCTGTMSGSAQVGASLPKPTFTIDPMVDGWYYDNVTCPGMVRVARLDGSIPAGAELVWTVENGTIVSGQGTAELQFAGQTPGNMVISAKLVNAEGCESETHSFPYMITFGEPEITVSVEPSVIPSGGTAIITTTSRFVTGSNLTSSLGDPISLLGQSGNSVQWEYRSTAASGTAVITYDVTNACGQTATATTTLTIEGDAVTATAKVRALGSNCSDYLAFAELTGVPPFRGTWSNGETFESDYPGAFLRPTSGGTYTLVEFSDANGPGTVTGEATFDFVELPRPELAFDTTSACAGSIVTASLTTPLPEGATATWMIDGGTIVSGQGTGSVQIEAGDSYVFASVTLTAPGACSGQADWQYLPVSSAATIQQPIFDLYGVYAGGSTQFLVYLDPTTESWSFENSLGDEMELLGEVEPNVYSVRYTSTHGAGSSTIRVYGTTACGHSFEKTNVMQILPPQPTATLTSTPNAECGATVTVTFTGTAPFTATWSDTGETFTTSETTVTRTVNYSTWLYVWNVSDAYGSGLGSDVMVDATLPPYVSFGAQSPSVGQTVTATAFNVPEGWQVIWTIEGTNARIVSGQGTAEVSYEGVTAGPFHLNAKFATPSGCEGLGSGYNLEVFP
jgi:hypothetical protein